MLTEHERLIADLTRVYGPYRILFEVLKVLKQSLHNGELLCWSAEAQRNLISSVTNIIPREYEPN